MTPERVGIGALLAPGRGSGPSGWNLEAWLAWDTLASSNPTVLGQVSW